MKRIFFTAGPSQYYPTVPQHLRFAIDEQIMSISHRGDEFMKIYENADSGLRRFLGIPESHKVFFFGSATEIWERITQNCIEAHSAHFVNGVFGERFAWTAKQYGKKTTVIEAPFGKGFDFVNAELPEDVEVIGLTHNESSNGVMLNMEDVHGLKDRYPEMLITLDVVSSMPYPQIDYTKVDVTYFSVQKGFGLPAGLGVAIISPQAFEKAGSLVKKGIGTGSYHSFAELEKYAQKRQTPETPNVMNLYLLGKVCKDLQNKGLETIRTETNEKAELMDSYFESHPVLKPFVDKRRDRSRTMAVVTTGGTSQKIVDALLEQGIEVGLGYGQWANKHLRIANFPAHSKEDIKHLLHALDTLSSHL